MATHKLSYAAAEIKSGQCCPAPASGGAYCNERSLGQTVIVEYERPAADETDGLREAKAFAASCYDSAAIEGISKAEIDEEYADLLAEFFRATKA